MAAISIFGRVKAAAQPSAACGLRRAFAEGEAVGYVPLDKRAYFVPEVLDGMEQLALVCIDNIECIAGDEEWEMAIFNLYNRILKPAAPVCSSPGIARRVS